jgi:hypothetical protein
VPDLIAALSSGITSSQLAAISKLRGVQAALPVDGGKVKVNGQSANVLGVSPQAFRSWTPLATASSAAIWSNLGKGQLVSTGPAARRLHLAAGQSYPVSAAVLTRLPFGGSTALSVTGADAIVNLARSAQFGLARNFAVLISVPPSASLPTLMSQVKSIIGKRGQVVNLVSYGLATASQRPVATNIPAGAPIVIGDQIRINRPAHKYRLTVEVVTPEGRKSASGVVAVHPDRSYTRRGQTRTLGDAIFVDLGQGKNLVALLAHIDNNKLELDGINYVALRAYTAASGGKRVSFNAMSAQTGIVPVKAELVPVLVTFADPANPASARAVAPDDAEAVLGKGYRLQGITAEVVPNGFWPIDFGGILGEPVTRGIVAKLPWLNGADHPAANALRAAGLPGIDGIDAREAFTRK